MLIAKNLGDLQVKVNKTENCRSLMKKCSNKRIVLIGFFLIVYMFSGCSESKQNQGEEYILKVGDRGITVSDFNNAFEIAKAAYPYKRLKQPKTLNAIRLRLIQQMTEEMILLERAEELGINISETEIDSAIKNIKRDYPDTVFNQMLLEYAVPYHYWKQGLKDRLLMEKVIHKELGGQIETGSADMMRQNEKHATAEGIISGGNGVSKVSHKVLIGEFQRKKMEKAYSSWMEKLKRKYPVEINRKLMVKIYGFEK